MSRPFHGIAPTALAICVLAATTGCAQMTRHSNTLVFATDTGIGLKVGQDANQMPSIEIGYNRQEAALIPLLANTSADGQQLLPCPQTISAGSVPNTSTLLLADCHFRATHDGNSRDAYSTMASFGAEVKGSGSEASVAVAQFFATGIAAQRLTMAGANLVQVSSDPAVAKANGDAAGKAAEAVRAEVSNAASVKDAIANGRTAAKLILGDSSAPVSGDAITRLAAEIAKENAVGCNAASLDALDKTSVDKFLDAMEATRIPCLTRLNDLIQK